MRVRKFLLRNLTDPDLLRWIEAMIPAECEAMFPRLAAALAKR